EFGGVDVAVHPHGRLFDVRAGLVAGDAHHDDVPSLVALSDGFQAHQFRTGFRPSCQDAHEVLVPVIGVEPDAGHMEARERSRSAGAPARAILPKTYEGVTPKVSRKQRVKCAESLNPAPIAA